MAARSIVLRNSPREALIKVVNETGASAPQTITVASLAATSQSISGTPEANIINIAFSADATHSGYIKITRNSVVVAYLTGTGEFQQPWLNDNDESTSDFVIDVVLGTVYLTVRKGREFVTTNQI